MSQDKSKRPGASSQGVRTLADLNNDGGDEVSPFGSRSPSANPGSDDEGSSFFGSASRRRQPTDFFAGGEKSGLAVQNPDSDRNRLVHDLLRRAELGGREEPPARAEPTQSRFGGQGHVLGSETVESRVIPETSSSRPQQDTSPVTRTLTFWRDGFSVENGELMRYDDPASQEILRAINSGRAPLHLLNVNPGQHVDVRVERRMTEDYVPPNPAKGGFYGTGHRLGS
ncbi:SEP domain-containing protein [Lipomyces kononenkoae]|uniref:SEP domain-containing protein n=1 Tax=Lipomyces kononenkoae TaxID=34357 RepID=A0ACC3TBQ0_LIPKO